jgi:hypothetical protein
MITVPTYGSCSFGNGSNKKTVCTSMIDKWNYTPPPPPPKNCLLSVVLGQKMLELLQKKISTFLTPSVYYPTFSSSRSAREGTM